MATADSTTRRAPRRRSNACHMSEYRSGDAVLIQFHGLLPVEVRSVSFKGRKVRYHVSAVLEMDVPSASVVGRGVKGGAR